MNVADLKASSSTLLLDAPFNDRMEAVFVPQGAFPPIQRIVLSTKYEDTATGYHVEDTHVFTSPNETWTWSVNLRDATKRGFSYKADVAYVDGKTTEGRQWKPGTEGTVLVGDASSSQLAIAVTAGVLDLTRYRLVVVKLEYPSGDVAEKQTHTMQFTQAAGADQTWTIPRPDPAVSSYSYTTTLYNVDGSKQTVGPNTSADTLLVLEAGS